MKHFYSLLVSIFSIAFSELFQEGVAIGQKAKSEAALTTLKNDIDDFNKDFEANFRDLQAFIRANLSLADTLDVTYLLFTPENRDVPYYLNSTQTSLQNSKFNPNLDVKFLIHGYGVVLNYPNNVIFLIKENLLEQGDYNVIAVNYTKYSNGLYTSAVRDSFLVSKNIADFLQFLLEKTGISKEKLHLIGHSIGSQICGNIGNIIPNLQRITGLDPAGPVYRNFPPSYRINDNSAQFIDVIHTSAAEKFPDGLGINYAVGHQDFFPNGGNYQPGCDYGDTWTNGQLEPETIRSKASLLICNHLRSEFLFAASILKCYFIGVKCNSYEEFNSGRCNSNNSVVAVMGFPANPIPGMPYQAKFYLNTSSEYPYCNQKKNERKGNILQNLWSGVKNLLRTLL